MCALALQSIPRVAQSAARIDAKLRRCKGTRFVERFWLDMLKHDERWLADRIADLKKERQYSRAVRDGLRLFLDLRDGRVDVLLELFPFVRAQLATAGQGDLSLRLAALEAQLALLKPMPAATNIVSFTPVMPPAEEDDTLLTVTKARSEPGKSSSNFLDAAWRLVQ